MKFTVSSASLLRELQKAAGAIASNASMPILEDFLFEIEEDELHITASDLETTIRSSMNVRADGQGKVAIPAKILLETLKALPEQPITISVDEQSFGVEITSSFGKYRLAGEDGADYPAVPQPEEVDQIVLHASVLSRGIGRTLFAASNDELRPAMNGVLFEVDFSSITFVATDAHKLVKYTFSDIESQVSASFIVPKKSLGLLKNDLPVDAEVTVAFNRKNAFFSFDNTHFTARLIDARYPDYQAVIPEENPNKLTVVRQDLLSSLKRIAIYANKTTNQVMFSIADDSLTISTQDLDFSNEATEQLSCTYEGEPLEIGFNAKFLIEMLSVLDSEEVRIELSNPTRAGILVPVDQPESETILMLVMPVMLGV